jgi:DnaJ-class molecular chaperone
MTENKTDKLQSPQELLQHVAAQKCPVCNGWGTVSFKRITCHACAGKGYILISIEKEKE